MERRSRERRQLTRLRACAYTARWKLDHCYAGLSLNQHVKLLTLIAYGLNVDRESTQNRYKGMRRVHQRLLKLCAVAYTAKKNLAKGAK